MALGVLDLTSAATQPPHITTAQPPHITTAHDPLVMTPTR